YTHFPHSWPRPFARDGSGAAAQLGQNVLHHLTEVAHLLLQKLRRDGNARAHLLSAEGSGIGTKMGCFAMCIPITAVQIPPQVLKIVQRSMADTPSTRVNGEAVDVFE